MWLKATVKYVKRHLAVFAKDDRASVSVDFVVAIPILLAVLVFTSEYGRVLQMRSVLDNAVSDATRYLARAPQDPPGSGNYPADVLDVAEQIITQRINVQHIAIGQPVYVGDTPPFETISLTVSIGIETPAISVISLISYGDKNPSITGTDASGATYEINYRDIEGFVLTATDTARYFGR